MQIRSGQIGDQPHAGHVGARKIGLVLDGTACNHEAQHRATGKIGAGEIRSHQPRAIEVRARELCTSQVARHESSAEQVGACKVRPFEVYVAEIQVG